MLAFSWEEGDPFLQSSNTKEPVDELRGTDVLISSLGSLTLLSAYLANCAALTPGWDSGWESGGLSKHPLDALTTLQVLSEPQEAAPQPDLS